MKKSVHGAEEARTGRGLGRREEARQAGEGVQDRAGEADGGFGSREGQQAGELPPHPPGLSSISLLPSLPSSSPALFPRPLRERVG